MDIRSIVPLDANSRLSSVMDSTEVSDFGADDSRECFQVPIGSSKNEAELNLNVPNESWRDRAAGWLGPIDTDLGIERRHRGQAAGWQEFG
jgi:hypothetical protein